MLPQRRHRSETVGDLGKSLAVGMAVGGADAERHEQSPPEGAERHRDEPMEADPCRPQAVQVGLPVRHLVWPQPQPVLEQMVVVAPLKERPLAAAGLISVAAAGALQDGWIVVWYGCWMETGALSPSF